MYIAGTEITITWIIPPSVDPLNAIDYDIRFFPADLNETYTDGAIVNYIYPSEFYSGSIQYVFTPLYVGLYQVYLTTGTADSYQVLDRKTFWCFEGAPQVEPSLDAISPGSTSGPLWVAPIIPIFPNTFMLQGVSTRYAWASGDASQHPSTKPYECIWAGRARWQSNDGPGTNQTMFGKWNPIGFDQSFMFVIGTSALQFYCQNGFATTSTQLPPFLDDERGWVKVTIDVTAQESYFYYSYDGQVWTQFGAQGILSGSYAYPDSLGSLGVPLTVGGLQTYEDWVPSETYYAKMQYTDLSVVHFEFDCEGYAGQSSFGPDPQGDTWNMNGGATLVLAP
jgi:hypothetical protein